MKGKHKFALLLLGSLLLTLLTACAAKPVNLAVSPTPPAPTQAVPSMAPVSEATPLAQSPVPPISGATETPFPTYTPYPLIPPTPTEKLPCERAFFIKDVTIADGSKLNLGESFEKTWRIRNDGHCPWSTEYSFIFAGGDDMQAPASIALPHAVAPGQEVDLTLPLVAPATLGTYKANFKLQNPSGGQFGIGNAQEAIYALINVVEPEIIFQVTSVKTKAEPAEWSQVCPYSLTLTADITSTKEGEVTYYWETGEGAKTPLRRMTFAQAGTLTTQDVLQGGQTGQNQELIIRLYIDQPNHQHFSPLTIPIRCP